MENGCPWDYRTCQFAAERGYVDVVRWAMENGCPTEPTGEFDDDDDEDDDDNYEDDDDDDDDDYDDDEDDEVNGDS